MKTINNFLFLVFTISFLTSCYTEYGGSGKKHTSANGVSGAAIFKKYCQTCHGAKDLSLSILPLNQRVEIIQNGKGVMTPFRAILSDEEIKEVAKYTQELKQ
jgi:mono/diheme cytochrome c family protein